MSDYRNDKQSEPAVRPKVPMARKSEKDSQRSSSKPIEQKTISVVDDDSNKKHLPPKHLPALHQSFVHQFNDFIFLPLPVVQSSDYHIRKPIDDLLNRINDFEANLHILLKLPYHRFWSTVIFDKTVNIGLRSYINNTPRFYLGSVNLDERVITTANNIHKLVFKVYLRLSINKEDAKNYMSIDYFGKTVMEKKIFDIPLLMDLCAIYGNVYKLTDQKLTELTERVLDSNSYFIKHLESSVDINRNKLTKIVDELGLSGVGDRVVVNSQQTHVISTLTWSHIVGVIEHIVGTVVPFSFFLTLSPTASKIYRAHRFDTCLVDFYETIFLKLKAELNSRFAKDARAKKASEVVIRQINIARCCLVNAFRSLVKFTSLEPLLDPEGSMDEKTILIDEFLDMASIATSSPCFLKDYFSKYSFDSDIYVLMEKSDLTGFNSVDPSRIDYLLNVMSQNNCGGGEGQTKDIANENTNNSNQNNGGFTPNLLAKLQYKPEPEKKEAKKSVGIDKIKLTSLVCTIKDFFPQLDDDMVETLLQMNNYDPEKVIDLISTGEIPHVFD